MRRHAIPSVGATHLFQESESKSLYPTIGVSTKGVEASVRLIEPSFVSANAKIQVYRQTQLSADTDYIGQYGLYQPIKSSCAKAAGSSLGGSTWLPASWSRTRPPILCISSDMMSIGQYNCYLLADIISADYWWVMCCRYLADTTNNYRSATSRHELTPKESQLTLKKFRHQLET